MPYQRCVTVIAYSSISFYVAGCYIPTDSPSGQQSSSTSTHNIRQLLHCITPAVWQWLVGCWGSATGPDTYTRLLSITVSAFLGRTLKLGTFLASSIVLVIDLIWADFQPNVQCAKSGLWWFVWESSLWVLANHLPEQLGWCLTVTIKMKSINSQPADSWCSLVLHCLWRYLPVLLPAIEWFPLTGAAAQPSDKDQAWMELLSS